MKLKLSMILILAIGVGVVLSTSIPEKISEKVKKAYEYVNPPEPTYWEEFKQALSDMNPFGHRVSREWCDAKCRVEEIIREHHLDAGDAKEEAKNIVEKIRDSLNRGAQRVGEGVHRMGEATQTGAHRMGQGVHRVGEIAQTAMYKTWHLLLHTVLAGFWLLLGALAYSGIQMYLDKRTFNKQLAAPLQGPVVLSKIFHVYGTEDTQKKFQDYWTNTAQQFFARQPGLRKFSLIRGVNVGSNCWCHMSEWNSVEDLRRAVNQPEIAELKKRMPKSFYSKRCISQIVTTGKGGAESARGEGDVRSEGLRQRGPGTQTTS